MPHEGTMHEAVAAFEAEGFHGQFGSRAGGRIICFTCRRTYEPGEIELVHVHRFEGTSDPAEEVVVAALVCACGARGTGLFTYGPMGLADDAEVVRGLDDQREHQR